VEGSQAAWVAGGYCSHWGLAADATKEMIGELMKGKK